MKELLNKCDIPEWENSQYKIEITQQSNLARLQE